MPAAVQDKYPEELDASVLLRLPCRTSTDDRYFGDQWQVGQIPIDRSNPCEPMLSRNRAQTRPHR